MYKGEAYDSRVTFIRLELFYTNFGITTDFRLLAWKQLITYRDKENALNKRMAGELEDGQAGDAFAAVILKTCGFDGSNVYANTQMNLLSIGESKTGSSSAKTVRVRKTQELEHASGK